MLALERFVHAQDLCREMIERGATTRPSAATAQAVM
jgi:hypothetical protein